MGSQFCASRSLALLLAASGLLALLVEAASPAEVAGVRVQLHDYQGPARLSVEASGKFSLTIHVEPAGDSRPLMIGVELPTSGPKTWPAADVEVLDSHGQAVSVRRPGIEWHKLLIPVSAASGRYVVHAVEPPGGTPRLRSEQERHVTDPVTGLIATIARWHGGRRAALSIRFDDSHPTHLSKAIPALCEYGFRGTFMVNPGGPDPQAPNSRRRSNFQDHRAEWEACARRGDQELANHTMHHRGARGDADMEYQVGEASKAIWSLLPGKSKLLALNLGGGTQWETTRALRYYLDKYHLFDASSGSLGMDDVYGHRVEAFRRQLTRSLESGGWCKIHFHSIGEGLSSSEANFRAVLDIAKQHQPELWIAGMADIYKYHTERMAARLELRNETSHRVTLQVSASTDTQLYDQALTIELVLPSFWRAKRTSIKPVESPQAVASTAATPEGNALRFAVPPITAAYVIENTQ